MILISVFKLISMRNIFIFLLRKKNTWTEKFSYVGIIDA